MRRVPRDEGTAFLRYIVATCTGVLGTYVRLVIHCGNIPVVPFHRQSYAPSLGVLYRANTGGPIGTYRRERIAWPQSQNDGEPPGVTGRKLAGGAAVPGGRQYELPHGVAVAPGLVWLALAAMV